MTFKKRSKRQGAEHHCLCGRKRRIARIHVTEMNLALVCDGCPAEQEIVLIKKSYLCPALGQGKSGTAPLQSASQNSNPHRDRIAPCAKAFLARDLEKSKLNAPSS